jgi:tetratricopeptide (TPR) repeat protein
MAAVILKTMTGSPPVRLMTPLLIVEAAEGVARTEWLAERLQECADAGARTFNVSCEFATGGPWGGVAQLFSGLLKEIECDRPDLIDAHGFELVRALPLLRRSMNIRGLSLTDLAPDGERTRNFAIDRAVRNVHGLIDLLDEWKSFSCLEIPWVIASDFFDDAGAMSSLFFRELMRRRGQRLNIRLIATVGPSHGDSACASFDSFIQRELLTPQLEPSPSHLMESEAAAQAAIALEERIGDDVLELKANLPRLIYLWKCAGQRAKLLFRQWQALRTELEAGQYHDAYRYSHGLLDLATELGHDQLKFIIVEELLVCHLTFGDVDSAFRVVEEAGLPLAEGDHDRLERLYFQIAMMYARFSKPRDFAKGEEYLDRGLDILEKSDLPDFERRFRYVFNRNGLAMIRNFQRRPQEAIELCRKGWEELEEHLPPATHQLHRSILLFNLGQVYALTGANDQALDCFSKTIAIDPNYSEYYNDRGSLLLKMDRLEEAEADYLRAIELSPPYLEVFTNLGQCYRRMGNLQAAIRYYSRALDLEPKQVLALLGRGKAHEEAAEREAAIEDYSAALTVDPTLWEALGSRGVLHYEAGRLQDSLADFDAAIALKPDQAELHENRAVVLADIEKLDTELVAVI